MAGRCGSDTGATIFRVTDSKVTAALRLPDAESALQLAHIHHELAATE